MFSGYRLPHFNTNLIVNHICLLSQELNTASYQTQRGFISSMAFFFVEDFLWEESDHCTGKGNQLLKNINYIINEVHAVQRGLVLGHLDCVENL